jgi:hypothetical protein
MAELLNEIIGVTSEEWSLPDKIEFWTLEMKQNWLATKLKPIVDSLYVPVSPSSAPNPQLSGDELSTSSLAFMRYMMDFMIFDAIIRDGDVEMITPMLKRLTVAFISLTSYQSKYAIECVNLLTLSPLAQYASSR